MKREEFNRLMTDWLLQFTEDFINENVIDHIDEVRDNEIFIYCLTQWDESRGKYESCNRSALSCCIVNQEHINPSLMFNYYHKDMMKYHDMMYEILEKAANGDTEKDVLSAAYYVDEPRSKELGYNSELNVFI